MDHGAVTIKWALRTVAIADMHGIAIPDELAAHLPLVDVVLWARAQGESLEVGAVQRRFRVSRATAYRWIAAIARARVAQKSAQQSLKKRALPLRQISTWPPAPRLTQIGAVTTW